METTLHRQLKEQFRLPGSQIEVKLGRFRIDVVNDDRLMEIQRSGLSSIRDKINKLLNDGFTVDVVKPLVARKRLIKLNKADGKEVDRRWSPLRGTILDLFDELVYFTRVFPHPNLKLITPLITIEEIRYPGQGKRRRRRKGDFIVQDRQILEMKEMHSFETVHDLQQLLPSSLPPEFDTKELASSLDIPRHQAQKIAYVMRKTGCIVETGKNGNAIVCRKVTKREAAKELKKKTPKRKVSVEEALAQEQAKASKKRATRKSIAKEIAVEKRIDAGDGRTISKPVAKKKTTTRKPAKKPTPKRKSAKLSKRTKVARKKAQSKQVA
jgi:hypothetical protein